MAPMTEADVPALAQIENLSSQNPWSAAQIGEELRKPASRSRVARAGGAISLLADVLKNGTSGLGEGAEAKLRRIA
jgi:hypothetical protein